MYAILKNNELAGGLYIERGCSRHEIPESLFYTDYGLLIPLNNAAFNILDFFDTGVFIGINPITTGMICLFITHEGKLYEFSCVGNTIVRRRIPINHESVYARANDLDTEQHLRGALELSKNIQEAFLTVAVSRDMSLDWYHPTTLPAVMERLKREGKTKPLPDYATGSHNFCHKPKNEKPGS
jgi:hypothetical protein